MRGRYKIRGCQKHGLRWWRVSAAGNTWCEVCHALYQRKNTEAHAAKMRARPGAVKRLQDSASVPTS